MNGDRINPGYQASLANLAFHQGLANPNLYGNLAGPRVQVLVSVERLEALEKRVAELEFFRRFLTDRILGEWVDRNFPDTTKDGKVD